jgi:hypothetical protein
VRGSAPVPPSISEQVGVVDAHGDRSTRGAGGQLPRPRRNRPSGVSASVSSSRWAAAPNGIPYPGLISVASPSPLRCWNRSHAGIAPTRSHGGLSTVSLTEAAPMANPPSADLV